MKDEAAAQEELSVVAGIVRRGGSILVCRRPEDGHMPGLWEFPGGKMEGGESPREALSREIGEELGIEVRVGALIWETRHRYPDRNVHLRFYDCEWKSGTPENLGVARHEWVAPSSLGRFDFLPADAPLIKSLMDGDAVEGSAGKARNAPAPESLRAAYDACTAIVAGHYENFPLASRLLPARLRPHIAAVYAFSRGADDIADGARPAGERLAGLDDWEEKLIRAHAGEADTEVFTALSRTMREFDLPLDPFQNLLSAFRQDVTVSRYPDYAALRDYCRRSADPVGRIVLMLHGIGDEAALRASDAICTGLQLANHLQDLREDAERGIIYMPLDEMEGFGVAEEDFTRDAASPRLRAFIVFQIKRARRLFREGLPLLARVRGAAGRELRAIWRGGVAALDSVSRERWDVCAGSPRLSGPDRARCVAAAFRPIYRLEANVDEDACEALDEAYCRWFTQNSKSNFTLSFLTLSAERRRGMRALYSYCRMVDDIADEPGESLSKKAQLEKWREAASRLSESDAPHPIIRELARAAEKFDIRPEHLEAICDGVAMDVGENRFEDCADLENYCDKVASAVGLACLCVFGARSQASQECAVAVGRALQTTNILRDVWEDAEEGRCYIPRQEMREHGVTMEDLRNKNHTPQVARLLKSQAARSRAYYRRADEAVGDENRGALLPLRIMARIYKRLLRGMVENDFRHMNQPPSLTRGEKLLETLRAFL